MPTPKKFWVQDGHVEQYPAYVVAGRGHAMVDCVGCHGGDATKSTRAEAHAGLSAIPTQRKCEVCHPAAGQHAQGSQHASLPGFQAAMQVRALSGTVGAQRFEKQCTKCHVATGSANEATCGHCHVSVPTTAGGGLLAGHVFQRTPSTDNNCTACHGSRVKDEYYAQNNELLARNAAAFPASSPWRGLTLQPDVHRAAGKGCQFCHSAGEMHGVGTVAGEDRYMVESAPLCTDCHTPSREVYLHTPEHLQAMTCQVCHAQPYKNCFGCHTDEKNGVAYYRINENDPTLSARRAANASAAPDALMTFRVGLNPRAGDPRHPQKYAVLRHVPVDRDVFSYSGLNAGADLLEGLFGDVTAAPTWKFATPHTIVRRTEITRSCVNCHVDGAAAARFWLTDPVADALGWIGHPTDAAKAAAYQADEQAANVGVVTAVPIPIDTPQPQ